MTKVDDENGPLGSTSVLTACSGGIIYHLCASQTLSLRTSWIALIFSNCEIKWEAGRACKTPCCLTNVTSFQLANVRDRALTNETLRILSCFWQVFTEYCRTVTLTGASSTFPVTVGQELISCLNLPNKASTLASLTPPSAYILKISTWIVGKTYGNEMMGFVLFLSSFCFFNWFTFLLTHSSIIFSLSTWSIFVLVTPCIILLWGFFFLDTYQKLQCKTKKSSTRLPNTSGLSVAYFLAFFFHTYLWLSDLLIPICSLSLPLHTKQTHSFNHWLVCITLFNFSPSTLKL